MNSRLLILFALALGLALPSLAYASGCGTTPSGFTTSYCIPINVVNTQSSTLTAGTQIQLTFPAGSYSSYEAANMMNAYVYNGVSGISQPAWLEGNVANENVGQGLSSNTLTYWFKIDQPIAASSSANGIYYIGLASTSTDLYTYATANIGAAPQLYCASGCPASSYGGVDNGNVVFIHSWNFSGTTTPSGWVINNGTIDNSLSLSLSTSAGSYYNYGSTLGIVVSAYGHEDDTSVNGGSGNGAFAPMALSTEGAWASGHGVYGIGGACQYSNYAADYELYGSNKDCLAQSIVPVTTNVVFSGYYSSTGATFYINYNSFGNIATTIQSPYAIGTAQTGFQGTGTYWWVHIATAPPNNIQPTVGFGAVQNLTSNLSLTFSPSSSVIYGTSSLSVSVSGSPNDSVAIYLVGNPEALCEGIGSCTYNIPNYAAVGTYTYTGNYLVPGPGESGTTGTLTVSKATPLLTFPTQCTSGAFSISPCTTTANIVTINNQLNANLYLNNALVATTNTQTTNAIDGIGTWAYTFNTLGNGNYVATSNSYSFTTYEGVLLKNVSSTGSIETATANILSPYTWNTYWPIQLSTQSPSNILSYSLYSQYYANSMVLQQSNVLNVSYIPPANTAAGNYTYTIYEFQSGDASTETVTVVANTLNMTDMAGALTISANSLCSPAIQYFPNCAVFPYLSNTFTAKPSSWSIKSDQTGNQHSNFTGGSNALEQFSNASTSFFPNITLTYPSPFGSLTINALNNPQLTRITQDTFKWPTTSSGVYTRKLINVSTYDQRTLNPLSTNTTVILQGLFNNYTISNTTKYNYNAITANSFYLYIPKSNYQNPTISFTTITLSSTASSHFLAIDNFCPTTINSSSYSTYKSYLVDLNGSLYTFNIYSGYGNSGVGDYIQTISGVSPSEGILVQQYKISGSPFAQALENGGSYAFKFLDSNCKQIYETNSSVWGNPISISIPLNTTTPSIHLANITASCSKIPTTYNDMNVQCTGSDTTDKVYQWIVTVYNATISGWVAVNSVTVAASTFSYTFNGLGNHTIYRVLSTAYVDGAPSQTQTFITDINSNSIVGGFGTAARALLVILFMLGGLGLTSIGEQNGMVSAQHTVSTTLIIEGFIFALTWMVGLSTFIPFPVVVIIIFFLMIIGLMSHRYESMYG